MSDDKVTVVDIGSGSLKASLFVNKNNRLQLLQSISEDIRICSQIGGNIDSPQMDQIMKFLTKVISLSKKNKSTKIIAVATQAARNSENFSDVKTKIFNSTGIDIRTISGGKEAGFMANSVNKSMGIEKFVSFDLGCGSIELAEFNGHIVNTWSLPLSALNLSKLPSLTLAESEIKSKISCLKFHDPKISEYPLIGNGGTLRLTNFLINNSIKTVMSLAELDTLFQQVKNMTIHQRIKIGLPKRRADVFHFGLLIIIELMKYMNIQEVYLTRLNLRSSIAFEYFDTL